jgi:hypothetical protein
MRFYMFLAIAKKRTIFPGLTRRHFYGLLGFSASGIFDNRTKFCTVFLPCHLVYFVRLVFSPPESKKPTLVSPLASPLDIPPLTPL